MVALNEVVTVSKRKCLVFKVDFKKAYNSVSWKFLDYVLYRFEFEVR